LISGEPVIYFGSRRAIFAFWSNGQAQGCQTPYEKKAKPRLKKAKPGKKAKLLNNMKIF